MRALLLLLLASCGVSPPTDIGTLYKCTGAFVCYGDHFGLTPGGGCADDADEALDWYLSDAREQTAEAKCGGTAHFEAECVDTGDRCAK